MNVPTFWLEREIESSSTTEHESELWLLSCFGLLAEVTNYSLACLRHQVDEKHSKEKVS